MYNTLELKNILQKYISNSEVTNVFKSHIRKTKQKAAFCHFLKNSRSQPNFKQSTEICINFINHTTIYSSFESFKKEKRQPLILQTLDKEGIEIKLTPYYFTNQPDDDIINKHTEDFTSVYYYNEISKKFKPSLQERSRFIEFITTQITVIYKAEILKNNR